MTSSTLLRSIGLTLALAAAPIALLADGLTDVVARKTLRVGVADFAPWTFVNLEGKPEGFEIDLGRQLAHDLGASAEFKLAPIADLFAALDRGEIDLIAAGLAITPARALRADFSNPYFESGTTLVTNLRLAPKARHPEDLNQPGITVATVEGTFSAGLAAELFDVAKLTTFPDREAAEAELIAGRAHALLTSVPDARILAKRHPDTVALPLPVPLVRSVAGFAVKRGNQALLNYLNAWVASRLADNYIPNLNAYWFDGYEWTRRMKQPAN
jgi:polar amino acid transport system substrate-binding protein